MKREYHFIGKILWEYDLFSKIKLIQDDGLMIDLVSRFQEIKDSFKSAIFQVSYYISDSSLTLNELIEENLLRISGAIEAEYRTEDYCYSSWTRGTDYETDFSVGKHNLLNELMAKDGKFLYMILKTEMT